MLKGFCLFVFFTLIISSTSFGQNYKNSLQRCQLIKEPQCQGIGYNVTNGANLLGHLNQEEASKNLLKYKLLINSKCSEKLLFFLCTMHFPLCNANLSFPVAACRPLCENVKQDCEPQMKMFGDYSWPESLNCSKLRQPNSKLCIQPPLDPTTNKESFYPVLPRQIARQNTVNGFVNPPLQAVNTGDDRKEEPKFENAKDSNDKPICDSNIEKYTYVKQFKKCLPKCNTTIDIMYSKQHKRFIYFWMATLAVICFVSSTSTVITFLVDSKRFRYPERAVVFLALSYSLYSMGYIIRIGAGPNDTVACSTDEYGDTYITRGPLKNTGCMATFLLLYYSGMAASVWWVCISVSWYMAAALKWGEEAIEANGFYFHLVAWLVPTVQTIAVFLLQKVDGDELTGMCFVGNWDAEALLWFVIVPLSCYLIIGTVALLAGFASLLKVQKAIKSDPLKKRTKKHKKLIFKIGLFSLLYTIPALAVIVIDVYEYKNHVGWRARAENTWCQLGDFTDTYSDLHYPRGQQAIKGYPYGSYRNYGGNGLMSRQPYGTYRRPYLRQPYNADYAHYGQQNGHINPKPHYQNDGSHDYGNHMLFTGTGLHKLREDQQYDMQDFPENYGDYYSDSKISSDYNSEFYDNQYVFDYFKPLPEMSRNIDCTLDKSIPQFYIFAVKIFMSLIAGIATGIWIWSRKTCQSWKKFCTCRSIKETCVDYSPKETLPKREQNQRYESSNRLLHDANHVHYENVNTNGQIYSTDMQIAGKMKVYEKPTKKSSLFSFFRRKSDPEILPHLQKKTNLNRRNEERYVQVPAKNAVYNGPPTHDHAQSDVDNVMQVNSLHRRREKYYENLSNKKFASSQGRLNDDKLLKTATKTSDEKYVAQKPNLIPQQYDIKLNYVSQPGGPNQLMRPISHRNAMS